MESHQDDITQELGVDCGEIVTVFKKIYLFFASVLYLDTLLVRQRRIVETRPRKGSWRCLDDYGC